MSPPRALLVLLCLGVFAGVTAALRHALPGGSGLDRIEVKLARFAAQRDDYSVLFFGSSRAYRGFVPSLFDARMAEHGVGTRSFNFGVPGSRAVEIQHLLGRVVALEPRGVRYVFVDPEGLSVLPDERNTLARSVIDWHDPQVTLLLSDYILASPRGTTEKAQLLWAHWKSCAYNVSNVGRALGWVDRCLGVQPSAEFRAEMLGPALDGYAPLGEEGAELGRRGERFQRKARERYLASVEEFRGQRPGDGPPSEAALALYRRIGARVRALGALPIFVTQPALYLQDDLIKAAERGEVEHLLRFDGPDRYPELYAPEHRYDATHLNDEGARLFTELLAREFARLLDEAPVQR